MMDLCGMLAHGMGAMDLGFEIVTETSVNRWFAQCAPINSVVAVYGHHTNPIVQLLSPPMSRKN